jgi:hypothetical protein
MPSINRVATEPATFRPAMLMTKQMTTTLTVSVEVTMTP